MAEYKISYCKVRERRGMPCYAILRLEYRSPDPAEIIGEFWKGVASFRTKSDAAAALAELLKGE